MIIYILPYYDLFGVLRQFQHCTGHIATGSWKGRGNQYIQFVGVLYCKLLPAFPLEAVPGTEPQPQRWEARVLLLCHRGPLYPIMKKMSKSTGLLSVFVPKGRFWVFWRWLFMCQGYLVKQNHFIKTKNNLWFQFNLFAKIFFQYIFISFHFLGQLLWI